MACSRAPLGHIQEYNFKFHFFFFSFFIFADGRLTEQEALDEIRALSNQLQHLRDRVPMRGNAHTTLSSLLDNCKPATNCLSLKPPPTTSGGGKKLAAIMNNNSTTIAPVAVVECADKSTNTNTMMTAMGAGLLSAHQPNGTACTRISITDDCDNRIEGEQMLRQAPPDTISTGGRSELSFGDLQLQCMCSDAHESDGGHCGSSHASSDVSDGRHSPNIACAPSFQLPLSVSNQSNHKQCCGKSHTRTDTAAMCACGRGQKRASSMKKAPQRNANRLKTNLSMDGSRDVAQCVRCDSNKSSLEDCELPVTPSPTVSSLSLGGTAAIDDKCSISEGNLTPGSTVCNVTMALGGTGADTTIAPSSSSEADGGNGLPDSSDSDPTASNSSSRRNKSTDSKLVIDLNDRSKYTKEVSV